MDRRNFLRGGVITGAALLTTALVACDTSSDGGGTSGEDDSDDFDLPGVKKGKDKHKGKDTKRKR